MQKKVVWLMIIAVIIGLIAWRIVSIQTKSPTGGNRSVAAVEVATAHIGPLVAGLNVLGTVQGVREATISGKITGRIQNIYVTDGTYATAGQIVLTIDSSEINAQINQSAALHSQAVANADNARTNLERMTTLLQNNAVAKQQTDNAQAQYQVYAAQVAQANATIALYQAQLANTVLTAPFSGYIANKRVVEGDLATANTALMSIIDISQVKIETTVGETDIGKISVGQSAKFTVDAYPQKTFSGQISEISPTADLKSRTFKVWILCDNTEQLLRSGMFARVNIPYKENPTALKIPKDALIMRDKKPCVFVINDGIATLTPIMYGLESDTELEILSGLAPDNIVSVWGHEKLNPGDKVNVVKRGENKP